MDAIVSLIVRRITVAAKSMENIVPPIANVLLAKITKSRWISKRLFKNFIPEQERKIKL